MLQNGHLKRAVGIQNGGDAGGPVGLVRLVFPGHQALAEIAVLTDGVRLVAVGDHQRVAYGPDGMIDALGIRHGRRVEGLRADAVVRPDKHAVAAVGAAAHDEIVNEVPAYKDAPAGVGILPQKGQKIKHCSSPLRFVPRPAPLPGAEAAIRPAT